MARCEVPDCTLSSDPYATYEAGHNMLTRHLMAHLVDELRNLTTAVRGTTLLSPPQPADSPKPPEAVSARTQEEIRPLTGSVARSTGVQIQTVKKEDV